jgi:polysaccharide deacetylase 2 family uncharacterized protein YibQ
VGKNIGNENGFKRWVDMKIILAGSSLRVILKKILFIYLPVAGCIFLSNYRLPDNIVPTISARGTTLSYALPNSLPVDPMMQRLLSLEGNSNEKLSVTPVVKKPEDSRKAKVAILIDDVGYNLPIIKQIAGIPIPLTWAVLPYSPYAKECLAEASKKNFEIILHLPLESIDETMNPGPGVLRHNLSEMEIEGQLNQDLNTVPGAIGVNNHMGSLGTQDPYLMACLMKIIGEKGLFFIDSRTTAASVAEQYALEYQVPYGKRRVFIDNDGDPSLKKAALRKLIKIALQDGSAIGIAHVREGNAAVITEMLPEFSKAGVEFVPVSELVK